MTAHLVAGLVLTGLVGASLAVGVLTGFLGVGGGFLIVPALMKVGRLDIRTAVSTSLLVIAMSSAAGLAAHLARGASMSISIAGPLIVAAVLGMIAGMRGARLVSGRHLQRAFAVFVASVGTLLIILNAPSAIRLLRGA